MSAEILRLDGFKLLIDDGLHADSFVVQLLELAETVHPLGPVRGRAAVCQLIYSLNV